MSLRVTNHLIANLTKGRTIEFIYAPKDISKYYKKDFVKHPRFGYYNKFYLTKNDQFRLFDENRKQVNTKRPRSHALKLFNYYYENPDFSTMIALTDDKGNNLVFYNSDTGEYY